MSTPTKNKPQEEEKKNAISPKRSSVIPSKNLKSLKESNIGVLLSIRAARRNNRKPLKQQIQDRVVDFVECFAESTDQISCDTAIGLLRGIEVPEERLHAAFLCGPKMANEPLSRTVRFWKDDCNVDPEASQLLSEFLNAHYSLKEEQDNQIEENQKTNDECKSIVDEVGKYQDESSQPQEEMEQIERVNQVRVVIQQHLEQLPAIDQITNQYVAYQGNLINYSQKIGSEVLASNTNMPSELTDAFRNSVASVQNILNADVGHARDNSAIAVSLAQRYNATLTETQNKKFVYKPAMTAEEKAKRVKENQEKAAKKHSDRNKNK